MVKFKTKKTGVSLTQALDNKIENLIYRMLDERSLEKQRLNNQKVKQNVSPKESEDDIEEDDLFPDIYLAKDLIFGEVVGYVLSKDLSLQRVKKVVLERVVDKMLKIIIAKEAEEIDINKDQEKQEQDSAEDNNEPETNLTSQNLMIDEDTTNSFNKDITQHWNVKPLVLANDESSENNASSPNNVTANNNNNSNKKKRSNGGILLNERSSKTKKSKIDRAPPAINLSILGGMDDVVAQLMELIGLPILHPEIYSSTGVEPPRGVLLHGPPGCGKTTIANALAGELQVPFISVSAPSVVSGMSGESEKKLRDLFDEAKSLAPCLVFLDEIDAITPKRDGGAQREMERRIVAQLLTSLDDLSFEKTDGKPVIVIGATNRPDSLDPALRRAGRFDREICLNVPNEYSRIHILQKVVSRLKTDGEIDFVKLAKLTPGFVGADLKALATAAGICAIKRIFSTFGQLSDDDSMDIDSAGVNSQADMKNTPNMIDPLPLDIIQRFIANFPKPLTDEQLSTVSIRYEDFLKALPNIQPTAKREGFATVPDVTWDNIGALKKTRIELNMAIVQPIKRPELYEKVGITAPAGVLLWGPPGCGKTLLAKAVANESRANFISIKGPELLNKYVGESERSIRQVFTRARASIPCVIFFDELDALVPRRDSTMSESTSRVVNTLLTELDGLSSRRGIFVIGATNRPDMIDPAMLRPGRLDKTLFIELPNSEEKLDILKTLVSCNGTPLAPDVILEDIVKNKRCNNFSGADLAALIRESSILALKRNFFKNNEIQSVKDNNLDKEFENLTTGDSDNEVILVTLKDFQNALNKIKPSVSDRDRLKYDRLNKKMGWIQEQDEEEKEDDGNNNIKSESVVD
ncbi:probable Ribosome biogenesis ATPase RIX7 [Saccharomycodes ludwigii]|uniref:Probable Ribosome biogenesis ATPase RIX7 n=1 Tax=Saccharomycodes ludwigii TaxID=36035 RepID=A0A376B7N4_9ASCO|nr:hypothetical protein SCDLUD_001363 [Saccharomycodes ludwigii]KAH3901599.1 hypothetical protein SCDLUD_001363 [Saccharomycodes ludwigii]SSD60504.1 probable Ribosome biogenesis ATPase RIX7 [Saccharomycodes ludwigii]